LKTNIYIYQYFMMGVQWSP